MQLSAHTAAQRVIHDLVLPDAGQAAKLLADNGGRVVVAVADAGSVIRAAETAGVPAIRLGHSGGQDLTLPDGGTISVAALRAAHERFFPAWMDGAG